MDWLDLLAVLGTLKSLLQHTASILRHSAFLIVQLSHPYITTGKTIALTRPIFVGKVMFLLFTMLSRLVRAFLPRSKHLLISWLWSPSAVIWEPILAGLIPISTERRNEDGRTEGATASEPWTQVSYFCIAGHLHRPG